MPEDIPPVTLGLLVFPGFPIAALSSFVEPLRAANEIAGKEAFRWHILGEDDSMVPSSAGVLVTPDAALAEAEALQHLLFASNPNARFENPARSKAALQRLMRQGTRLGAVSGGVFPLARTGLVKEQPISVHWCYAAAFQAEFPFFSVQSSVISQGGGMTSISGTLALFDHMLSLVGEHLGPEIMAEAACWFQHPFVRSPTIPQKLPALATAKSQDLLPKQVVRAIQYFTENIEYPVSMTSVAEAIGISTRNLERSFKEATGQSPLKYYRKMRMKQARQLVLYTNDSIAEVAFMVGYSSSGTFRRHYKEAFGIPPDTDRQAKGGFRLDFEDCLPS
ncbi:transcriptional regulator, AraC family protein [Roseobacter sp. SK209-2-6]|uniref:GlxA family transcriptional regulator n=1 Tax=Roseobacter sp. SK209-2-6 TaxID=388739 RepID=UPI0000F3C177|nr:helix-turn-helix domain-containing protein [Roseobacter sp. SK209-2-6]EBA15460.1 transcriptional regulator, AraC family protein [Roseobacter sp. SK209-2-6]